jgi:hypothetical protein
MGMGFGGEKFKKKPRGTGPGLREGVDPPVDHLLKHLPVARIATKPITDNPTIRVMR